MAVVKKTAGEPVGKTTKHATDKDAGSTSGGGKTAGGAVPEATSVAAARPPTPRPTPRPAAKRKASGRRIVRPATADKLGAEPMLKALRAELRSVKDLVQTLVAPPSGADPALEGAVDSLRRLLSEVIEQRMEGLVRDLVDLRSEAAAIADGAVLPIVQRVDQLLDTLGAIRFHAEPMDLVDPLIHVVLEEWQRDNVPEGVVLETIRPGFRTARGRVLCKAAVAVNKRT